MTNLTKEMQDALELARKIVLAHGYAISKHEPEPRYEPWPEPRPYTIGDEIKVESHPKMRAFALMEHTDSHGNIEVFVMRHHVSWEFDTHWYGGQHDKAKCTHLDGTPLGEFRAVPLRESGIAFPTNSPLKKGWADCDRNHANTAILAFRDKLRGNKNI